MSNDQDEPDKRKSHSLILYFQPNSWLFLDSCSL